MNADDAYWDDLGVAWRAAESNLEHLPSRLHAKLRRQSFAIAAAAIVGFPLGAAGVCLGLFTIWRGWSTEAWNFVTRGTGIVLVSGLLVRALAGLLPFSARADMRALSDMLAVGSARARRTLFLVRAGIAACAIAAVFGIAGTAIRIQSGSPPGLSPVIDLAILALIAACLAMYGRLVSADVSKFEYLRRSLGSRS